MVKRGSACNHPSRPEIDRGLMQVVPYRALAGQFDLSPLPSKDTVLGRVSGDKTVAVNYGAQGAPYICRHSKTPPAGGEGVKGTQAGSLRYQ